MERLERDDPGSHLIPNARPAQIGMAATERLIGIERSGLLKDPLRQTARLTSPCLTFRLFLRTSCSWTLGMIRLVARPPLPQC